MFKETRNKDRLLHSYNDEPAFESADGTKYWYQNGQLHRLDGPAVEYTNRYKYWNQNGFEHRLDGTAVEWSDGTKEYWIEGKRLSEEDFLKKTAPLIDQQMLNELKDEIQKHKEASDYHLSKVKELEQRLNEG